MRFVQVPIAHTFLADKSLRPKDRPRIPLLKFLIARWLITCSVTGTLSEFRHPRRSPGSFRKICSFVNLKGGSYARVHPRLVPEVPVVSSHRFRSHAGGRTDFHAGHSRHLRPGYAE